ncbi:DUF1702 family protein [Saccharothrix sp. ST-888]|uniref:DUF1702 family protein n=1 Tax=Saccharothrix sp. ST-888 TaxID=1427391 RepID=UPI0005EC925D|nr:DUF1702 family protein [Saccharothrix sp. ST-888]KJK58382.1 enediyne biosynthesis protein [Saccharothrix sp. ST-888]
MPTLLGSFRRLVLAPQLAEVTFTRRGFPVTLTEATRRLEAVPQAVVCGFEWGMDVRDQWEIERRLSLVEPEQRGFAYEGAVMAFTVLDATAGGTRTRDLLLGPGQPHIFLAYIGIGFAMARLPRPLWKKVLPDLSGTPYHPVMSWLAVDGYAFDRAYFDTGRWVDRQYVPAPYPWEGAREYFPRAVDQGIGRALWFIHGAHPDQVAAAVARFAAHRRPDLWSGVGLAATFAGGCPNEGLAALRAAAGEHRAELAQGAVFAIRAREYSGHVPPHSAAAVEVLTGRSVEQAVKIADDGATYSGDGSHPAYELWRSRVRREFSDLD